MANSKSDLSSDERAIFDAEWNLLFTRRFQEREVMDIYEDHRDSILDACKVAKYELEADFGGANARTNEFGWMPILPNHLLTTDLAGKSTSYSESSWDRFIETDDVKNVTNGYGWINWIGASDANFKLSKYCCMVCIGFSDPVPEPKIDAILAKIKSVDYPIWYFGDRFSETDYHSIELTMPFIVEPEQEFYLQTLCGRAGADKLRPLGAMFAKGDYMRDKTAFAKV